MIGFNDGQRRTVNDGLSTTVNEVSDCQRRTVNIGLSTTAINDGLSTRGGQRRTVNDGLSTTDCQRRLTTVRSTINDCQPEFRATINECPEPTYPPDTQLSRNTNNNTIHPHPHPHPSTPQPTPSYHPVPTPRPESTNQPTKPTTKKTKAALKGPGETTRSNKPSRAPD